ncbi:hypothetical protein [Streptomyces sp. NPDC005890]|uniref:hypothetical protein n=1 Tax=Streptomyces sp. NPDC005890 TaxID=3154568 RepID=UPI0033C42E36
MVVGEPREVQRRSDRAAGAVLDVPRAPSSTYQNRASPRSVPPSVPGAGAGISVDRGGRARLVLVAFRQRVHRPAAVRLLLPALLLALGSAQVRSRVRQAAVWYRAAARPTG